VFHTVVFLPACTGRLEATVTPLQRVVIRLTRVRLDRKPACQDSRTRVLPHLARSSPEVRQGDGCA